MKPNVPERLARHLVKRYDLKYPMDLERLARFLNINLLYVDDISTYVTGMLIIKPGGINIVVNENHTRSRQRFAIAHAIGHYAMHKDESHLFIDGYNVIKTETTLDALNIAKEQLLEREVEANQFALELLINREDLYKKITEVNLLNDTKIKAIAKEFKVDKQTLAHRLFSLGIISTI